MNEDESLFQIDRANNQFTPLNPVSAAEIGILEKDIETWVVNKPDILFSDHRGVMVIAQEITGEMQADVMAIDSQGKLIVIEIKRHGSDRAVIGQILDYASQISKWDYEHFNERWKKGLDGRGELRDAFLEFVDNDQLKADKNNFLKDRQLYILAAGRDENMMRIITWLKEDYKVPIDFVPFTLFKCEDKTILKIGKINVEPVVKAAKWNGDWFFNSNETYAPNACKKMIEQNVIAAYGYGSEWTEHKMNLPEKGNRVFLYVNKKGIVAVGEILEDASFQSDTVFAEASGDEYHRRVRWAHIVDPAKAVTGRECSEWGYYLPVRCTIGKLADHRVANLIEKELVEREQKP